MKKIFMQYGKTILWLTTELLANGAFSHLKDEQISSLHHLLLRLNEPLSPVQQRLLLTFWNNADAAVLQPELLYRCNAMLQQYGFEPLAEIYEVLEAE